MKGLFFMKVSSKESLNSFFYEESETSPYTRYFLFNILSWITFQKIGVIEKYKKHFNKQIETGRIIR
ncbi:hypothetical protein B9C88_01015 [Brevibacillus laterosporus]|nr:hypothetical protein B9C88_01015 [Brevibacillus laterosporus]